MCKNTTKKVQYHTNNIINDKIRNNTLNCINTIKDAGSIALSCKIDKLNDEWDTERVLETSAASFVLAGSIMGYKKSKCSCFLFTGAVGAFLLQHALHGWCPPLPIIRKMGIRTAEEIHDEKTVLKFLRGDFSQNPTNVQEMLEMVEKQ